MSDKSFGDHTNKNIVKNPLLSSAVTGLSLEDLTHKAVLLPVTPPLGQIASSDQHQGSQATALAHTKHETPALPSGDAFRNITLTNTQQITKQNVLDSKNNVKLENYRNPDSFTQSKASLKTDDDFDVNEYIARLQGTRYVSAPLHSHLKEDQNANLEATEENLEEINLNETQTQEVQQSLTADIAQNFSQLPTVLPHVASAVFSSFTNMLNYKREHIPEQNLREPDQVDNKGAYDKVQFQKPDTAISQMGLESYGVAKEVAPPPKEPPISGIGNFRITTKKKYAQIPGLSSGDAQTMTFNAPAPNNMPVGQNIPYGQNMPPFSQPVPYNAQELPHNTAAVGQIPPIGQGMPPVGQNIPPVGQSMLPVGQSMPPVGQSMPPVGQRMPPVGQRMPNVGQSMPPFGQSMPPVGQSMPPVGQSMPPVGQSMPPIGQSMPLVGQSMPPVGQSMPPVGQSMPPVGQSMPPYGQSMPLVGQSMPPVGQSMPPVGQSIPPVGQSIPPIGQSMTPSVINTPLVSHGMPIGQSMASIDQKIPPFGPNIPPTSQSLPKIFNPNDVKKEHDLKPIDMSTEPVKSHEANITTQNVGSVQCNIFNPTAESQNVSSTVEIPARENKPNLYAANDSQNFFTPIDHKEQNIPSNPPGSATIIPPPPMFSNLTRRDSQSSVGKSILPPSVARRISGNQHLIKPTVSTPSLSENIFVPAPVLETSEQASSSFPTGFSSSAFVPAYPSISESTGPPFNTPLGQTNAPYGTPPVEVSQISHFIPTSSEKSAASTELSLSSKEKHTEQIGSKVLSSSTCILPPTISTANFPPSNVSIRTTDSNTAVPNFAASNVPPNSSIFTPENIDVAQSATTMFPQPNLPPPPTFFNPLQHVGTSSAPHPITQMPPIASEPPKPIAEPPKAAGNVNFRMTKKRPQYYAGPIEGVGSISNNVKPIIAPVLPAEVSNVPSALFTPELPPQPIAEQYVASNIEQASVQFDISRPAENISAHKPFDINIHEEQYTPFNMNQPESQNYGQEYNTAFDMSRSVTDAYNPPKQESKGFGIIGSLKSKLSSIDINKIQSSVTTFFDPAYNDTKVAEPVSKDNLPYEQHQYGYQQQQFRQTPQEQSNFDIFVPNVEHHQYSQYKEISYNYGNNNQYYQSQESYSSQNQSQNVYSTSSYFTNPNYSTEQVYSSNPLFDSTQAYPPNVASCTYIPEKTENVGTSKSTDHDMFYNPNVYSQENMPVKQQQAQKEVQENEANEIISKNQQNYFPHDLTTNVQQQTPSYSGENIDKQNLAATVASEKTSENITHFDPNAYKQENSRKPADLEHSFDASKGLSQATSDNDKVIVASTSLERSQEPMFYNPNTFTKEDQSQFVESYPQQNVASNFYKESSSNNDLQLCDSALNTSKYTMSNIQQTRDQQNVPTASILQASLFFDMPQTTNVSQLPKDNKTEISTHDPKNDVQLEQKYFDENNLKINKIFDTPTPANNTKSLNDLIIDEQTKQKEREKVSEVEKNLIESLTKNDIPILGVSTMPLFGLSTMIANKSEEYESENNNASSPYYESTYQPSNFGENTGISFFENLQPDNKIISECQLKEIPRDITALSITDVKNVLVIDPPQENIGELLKRNASSSKLVNLQKAEVSPPDHFTISPQQTENKSLEENINLKFDKNVSENIFQYSDIEGKEAVGLQKKFEDQGKDTPDLNICETCREVNTPDIAELAHKSNEPEDLTTQLIENITSRMQLSNPLTVPFTESEMPINERPQFDKQQFEEIAHVAEETIETLNVQSATELLDDRIDTSEIRNYGWAENATLLTSTNIDHDYTQKVEPNPALRSNLDFGLQINPTSTVLGSDYEFNIDPNSIGFFDDNSLFFDKLPTNASDEIKAEIKHSHEDVVLPREMNIPSAPPHEEDIKLDEHGVIDVHSIEQDAKKDFPLEEEFIIEPSDDFLSTDDDKIESRERKKSSEDSTSNDTFTNRVERFKKKIDNSTDDLFDQKRQGYGNAPMSMASYFDTGNYAVESHYKNSLSSPTSFQYTGNVLRIPPGFEEEYARRMSGLSLSGENKNEPQIPETSTQTKHVTTLTYASSQSTEENIRNFETHAENADSFIEGAASQTEKHASNVVKTTQSMSSPVVTAAPVQTIPAFTDSAPTEIRQNIQPLQDPMNFFSANVEVAKSMESEPTESFSRLASYFSMPPAQPEHSKSFFELSESQNHYRHDNTSQNVPKHFFELSLSQNHYIDDVTKNNLKDLMVDLTSPRNIQENVIKTVNYFSVEIDDKTKANTNAAPIKVRISDDNNILSKLDIETKAEKPPENVNKDSEDAIYSCKICLRYLSEIGNKDFKVRTATNEPAETKKETANSTMKEDKVGTPANYNFVTYDVEGQSQDGVTILTENRAPWDYRPVKHHWFYRVDIEDKSVWRGFSITDSQALENAYQSPTLDDNTLVATDGGRYDVNVKGRLRIAVYWKEKPTNVRRCSWFYKGTTDARYVPYTEPVAEKLEEEYRHGITTGEWHRKLALPNSELVIMHGPSVMVHFLHSTTDAFSSPPSLLGKRVYRNTPNIKMAKDQLSKIDHLIFLVHGAGEYKRGPYVDQTTTRPRVVRRGHEESEIEDCEPSKIDHLLLLCHGVGSACDMKFRSVEEVVEDFRSTTLQLLQSHYKNSYDNGIVSRVEVLPISWHDQLHSGEGGVDKRLARVTLDSIPRLRAFTNHTVLDVLFYTSPVFHQTIIDTVCSELNRVYSVFQERNPLFKGGVSLGGHSLGSVILYDLLCHQIPKSPSPSKSPPEKTYVSGTNAKEQPALKYPQLVFPPDALYALGSPIAIFECIRGVESLGINFSLPTCKHFFNIFHPYDPIAYRIEPLINPFLQDVKPSQIPHHKGRKRMHLELKDTMARVGADLKQKLIESLRTTWNKWKASPPPEGQLEKVVEEEIEKEQLREDDQTADVQVTPEMLGKLNSGRRIDYVLQEAPLEIINEYLFAMSSHVGYWESEDTMLLMLREIYSKIGVQPDSTVPQQSMSVQRTRTVSDHDENGYNETDYPSTSRGST